MNEPFVRNVVEAALLAAGKSLHVAELAQLFDDNSRPSAEEIRAALAELSDEYSGRGIEVKETAAGFRIQVRRELANEVSRLWPERPAKYSRALLETLALIAYRQPITRAESEAVRGVAVNPNIITTLLERNGIRVVGDREVPGHPVLLGTTREFLEYFGLRSLDELPPLAQLKALGELNMQLELPGAPVAGEGTAASTPQGEGASPGVEGAQHEADADAEASAESGSTDADDASEDDELSADGSRSRELVAAPRDTDD
jgi:segregation and condensation protein B